MRAVRLAGRFSFVSVFEGVVTEDLEQEVLVLLMWLEIGQVDRFSRAENLASYAGLMPRIIASGVPVMAMTLACPIN